MGYVGGEQGIKEGEKSKNIDEYGGMSLAS